MPFYPFRSLENGMLAVQRAGGVRAVLELTVAD